MAPPEAHAIITSSHPDKVRMLVLETDDAHPDTQKEKGGLGEVLGELFKKAGDEHDPPLGIETVIQYIIEDQGGKVPEPKDIGDDIHAILITGSVYDAHSDEKWILKLMDFVKHIWKHRPDIKFTGICFGHQILCRTLGSKVKPADDGSWEISHTAIELTDVGRSLFNLPSTEKHIHLHQMHKDFVEEPPKPTLDENDLLDKDTKVYVWGKSKHTGVQGCYIRKRLFTTQGHMEFDENMVKRQLEKRVESGALKEEDANEAIERADWVHNGLLVAKAILRFFHGDDDEIQ